MQVFMPWPSYEASARMTDNARLQKGLVEAYQIVRAGCGTSTGWSSHPAVKMWQFHVPALVKYVEVMSTAWYQRGYTRSDMLSKCQAELGVLRVWGGDAGQSAEPPWAVGNREFHLSHQFNLMRKRPDIYRAVFQCDDLRQTTPDEPYLWPLLGRRFQVGAQSEGKTWLPVFGGRLEKRTGALIVTASQAEERYRRDHPEMCARYDATAYRYENLAEARADEMQFSELLRHRTAVK